MNKRDLKEDLEKFEKINKIIPEPCGDFIRDVVAPHALQRAIAAEEEVERLKRQINDALTVISDTLTDVMDMLSVAEMEGRDMELCPQANMLSLHDELNAAIQRIQEGKQS